VFGTGEGRFTSTNCGSPFGPVNNTGGCLWDGPGFLNGDFANAPDPASAWGLASVDSDDPNNIPGTPMPTGGPFAGSFANFNIPLGIIGSGFAPLVQDDTGPNIAPNTTAASLAILANDSDIDAAVPGPLVPANVTVNIIGQTGGTATVKADNTIDWLDTSGAVGADSFTYTVTDADGNTSAAATVSIAVGIGSPPVAVDPQVFNILEDAPTFTINDTDLLSGATDPDVGDVLTVARGQNAGDYKLAAGTGALVDNGSSFGYTPPANFNGVASFTYTITDGNGNFSQATATINVAAVNDAPVAQNDPVGTAFNTPVVISVLGNDSDVDGDTISVQSTSTPANGSVVTNSDNTITYTPITGFSGADSFDYTITDGVLTATATVNVSVLGAAQFVGNPVPNTPTSSAITGGSNFTMLNANGEDVGGTNDVDVTWDGTIRTSEADPTPNMTIQSFFKTKFFGFEWNAKTVRVFGPGNYTFEACPNDGSTRCTAPAPMNLAVGPTQLGMHMTFDWGDVDTTKPCGVANCNIDVVETVELNKAWAGALDGSDVFGARNRVFNMAVADSNGDGIPGQPMVDGAFIGFNSNFNLNFTPAFGLPAVSASVVQNGKSVSVIVPVGGPVTVTATAPAGATFDWNSTLLNQQTDAVLVGANTNGMTNATFVFDPSGLTDGPVVARVTIRDPNKGNLANYAVVPMVISSTTSLAAAADVDGNGIPDGKDVGLPATQLPAQAGNGATFVVQAEAGAMKLGKFASSVGNATGNYAVGINDTDTGVPDTAVTTPCAGGCFDFEVFGLATAAKINVVVPLSAAIEGNSTYRKFVNGEWRDFSLLNGDAISSAPGSPGTCPAPGDVAYQAGLNVGDFCVQLTITDGGRNDADFTANGTIVDPGGVGSGAIASGGSAPISAPNTEGLNAGGGCAIDRSATLLKRADWWLVAGLLGFLGWFRHRSDKRS